MAKGKIVFDEQSCKGCELCVSVCPKKIIAMSHDKVNAKGYQLPYVTDMNECIACVNCAIMCPDSVITVYKEK